MSSSTHRLARIEGVGLHREFLAVGRVAGDQLGHLVGAEAGALDAALLHARHDRLGRGAGVGADVQVGGAQALPQAARVGVDLDGARAGIEVAALGGVVAERRAGADHQVGLGEALAREVAGEGAGDVERVGIAVEQALAEQRRRRQRAGLAASASSAWAAPDRMAPRPAIRIGFSASAIMSTTRSTIAGSGTGRCAAGARSEEGV